MTARSKAALNRRPGVRVDEPALSSGAGGSDDACASVKVEEPSPYVPFLRGCVHLVLIMLSPVLIVWLTLGVVNTAYIAEYAVAFTCCCLNFAASAILHYTAWDLKSYDVFLKLDYAFIFIMIGGSAVPSTFATAKDNLSVLTTLAQWIGIAVGTVGSLAFSFVTASPALRVMIYFAVGSPYIHLCYNLYHIKCFTGLFSASMTLAIYMLGGLIYAKKSPDPAPDVFGFHELFHLCCALALVTTFVGNHKISNYVNNL